MPAAFSESSGRAADHAGGDNTSVKIRVSYERQEELERIMRKLAPDVKHWKIARRQDGHFKRAYAEVENLKKPEIHT